MFEEILRVLPSCCEKSAKHKVPFLDFLWTPYSEREGFLKDRKPNWCVKGTILIHDSDVESVVEIKFCPFCGKNVPEIELNPLAKRKKIYNTDSGDYCESCGKRSMCCNCLPAPFRWKPVGVELKLPKKIKHKEDE